jgi:hypothetical protein
MYANITVLNHFREVCKDSANLSTSIGDPHQGAADPDPSFHFDAVYFDANTDPSVYFDADTDRILTLMWIRIHLFTFMRMRIRLFFFSWIRTRPFT